MSDINCLGCGHDIGRHSSGGGCLSGWDMEGDTFCDCDLHPADIARALLTAEPTEAEVEQAAAALWAATWNTPWLDPEISESVWDATRRQASAALRAAAEARR